MTDNAVIQGDCVEVMAGMEPESVDAIVTDPPYGLEFMGKEWDRLGGAGFHAPKDEGRVFSNASGHMFDNLKSLPRYGTAQRSQAWHERWAQAAYRVAKPSAYLLAFGGTRTVHRMTTAIEDAGWVIRDLLVWAYASGFPKSKASLKPAWEPIVLARKPGPLRDLNIDQCRIPFTSSLDAAAAAAAAASYESLGHLDGPAAINVRKPRGGVTSLQPQPQPQPHEDGRWPSNVLLTDPVFDGGIPGVVGGGVAASGGNINGRPVTVYGGHWADSREFDGYTDSGTYSRFFLIPKADRADREPVLGGQLPLQGPIHGVDGVDGGLRVSNSKSARANAHPTVKPTDLMRHLVRLVTPPGGLVLDPFLGSGTTAIACELEGFRWIGIEKEPEYVAIANARLNGTQRGLGLSA